jgi:hypothetical protein
MGSVMSVRSIKIVTLKSVAGTGEIVVTALDIAIKPF